MAISEINSQSSISCRPSWSRTARQLDEGALNAYSWATRAPWSSYQRSGPILQGISKQAMGSRRQNTDEPPSTQAAATQDWGLSRELSFQYKNFTHFNGHYNFKESNFHHCLSSASWFVERGHFAWAPHKSPSSSWQRSFQWYLSLVNYRSNC